MKIKHLLIPVLFLFVATTSYSQTADEIIAKYFEALGGQANWAKVEGIKMTAKVNQGGVEFPLVILQLKDGKQAQIITFQGKEIKQGVFDGTTLWSHNFMNMKAEKSDAESTENLKANLGGDFPMPLFPYKKMGYKVELMGKETIDGSATFKIKLTKNPIKQDGKPKENIEYYFFDAENFVPLMVESEITDGPMKGQIGQVKFSDFQEVNGLMFPFSWAQGVKGQSTSPLNFTTIEVNPKVEASLFTMPAEN